MMKGILRIIRASSAIVLVLLVVISTVSAASKSNTRLRNPLTVKGRTVKISGAQLIKRNMVIFRKTAIIVRKAKGKVTYRKVSGNGRIAINRKTGKITICKGLKYGKYKVRVKVRAAGNKKYRAKNKTVTVTILVRKPADSGDNGDNQDDSASGKEQTGPVQLYVDCNALTTGNGTDAEPFGSIEEAVCRIRQFKDEGKAPSEGVCVYVKKGMYELKAALEFSREDSGTAEGPVRFISEEPQGAVLTGGTRLYSSDFSSLSEEEAARIRDTEAATHIMKVDLKKHGLGPDDWGRIFATGATNAEIYSDAYGRDNVIGDNPGDVIINNKKLNLARYPNEGFLSIADVIEKGNYLLGENDTPDPSYPKDGALPEGPVIAFDNEAKSHIVKWMADDIWMYGQLHYDWHEATYPVESIQKVSGEVKLGFIPTYPPVKGGKTYFFNVFEELDAPGEYYIDRKNGILYVYAEEGFDDAEIMITTGLHDLVSFGDGLSHFSLEGFRLKASRKDAVAGTGTQSDVALINCKIENISGGQPVHLNGTDLTVSGCEICFCDSGIALGGGDAAELAKSGNVIENCYIHDIKEQAVTISGCGGTVRHNEIANVSGIGMSGPCLLGTVEYNDIHDVCLDTSDSGAVYSQAGYTNYGAVTRYNYIHEIGAAGTECHGIYWDDVSSGQTAYGNVIVNTSGRGFMIGGGRDNIIKHNVIVEPGADGIMYDERAREGQYEGGWWGTASGKWQFSVLASSPYQNPVWKALFPELAQVKPYPEQTDKDDPFNAVNPAGSVIEGNVIYSYPRKAGYRISDGVAEFSDVENNITSIYKTDFVSYKKGNYTLRDSAKLYESIPDFGKIDFSSIGRKTS